MKTIEKNALRIAELMGHDNEDGANAYEKVIECCGYAEWLFNGENATIKTFSSYNGLMPIRFECNSNDSVDCFIELGTHEVTVIRNESDYRNYPYNRESEPEFIEAIQLACIKYLELKCGY